MQNILFVEDDIHIVRYYITYLSTYGFSVTIAKNPDEALLEYKNKIYDLVICDIMMPPGLIFSKENTLDGKLTGILLAKKIREINSKSKIIAYTNLPFKDGFNDIFDIYLYKQDYSPEELARKLYFMSGDNLLNKNVFIVHGHDNELLLEAKNYFQNKLGFREPTILNEQPSQGKTIIEKFEEYAQESDLVVVLMTPDDKTIAEGKSIENIKNRARQNVIFEYGYFLGYMGRKSGKIIFLCKGKIEIPSDISGLIYIDVSNGIEYSGETIRRELGLL